MASASPPAAGPHPPATPGRGRGGRGHARRRSWSLPPPVLSAGCADEAESLVDLQAFDAAAPERFYLPEACEQLVDCYALVQGVRLPLHSAVLALQSGVLRRMFVDLLDPQATPADKEPAALSSTFADCSLQQAACFLRLTYRPDHATAASLGALHKADAGLPPALVRLAHCLDALPLLGKLEACLQGAAASASIPDLLAALQLAEGYHLQALRTCCVQLLARRLAGAGPFWHEQASKEQLAGCSADTLARLVGEMAGAVHAGAFEPPQVFSIGRGEGGKGGGFTFVLTRFSRQTGRVTSPWVKVGGLQWRLKVWPHGDDAAGGLYLSAYLEVNAAEMRAKGLASVSAFYEFAILDQSGGGVHYVVDCGRDTFTLGTGNWGKTRMMPHAELKSPDRHFLDHDRLAVRINMRVMPPTAAAGGPAQVAAAADGQLAAQMAAAALGL